MKTRAGLVVAFAVFASAVSVSADQPSYLSRRVGTMCATQVGARLFGINDPTGAIANWNTYLALPSALPMLSMYISTTATTNSTAGFVGTTALFGMARPSYSTALSATFTPYWFARVQRNWVAISSGDLTQLPPVPGPAVSALHFVGVVFDSLHGADLWVCSGDGTNYSCIDTGVSATALPGNFIFHKVYLDWSTQTSLATTIWRYDPVALTWSQVYTGTKTTNLSASTTISVGPTLSTTNTGLAAATIATTGFAFYQNN
jgi:hypothetical protein